MKTGTDRGGGTAPAHAGDHLEREHNVKDSAGMPVSAQDARDGEPGAGGAAMSSGVVSRVTGVVKRHKRVVRLAVLALIIVFVGLAIQKSWAQLPEGFTWKVNWAYLVLAYLTLVAQELCFALIWRAILARLGSRLAVVPAERIYLNSEFVRYIPGNVWHVFTRVLWAEREGVPRVTGFASMTIELATKVASAALVFAVSLLAWPDVRSAAGALGQRGLPLTIAIVGVPLLLVGLHPRVLSWGLNFALRKLGRPAFTLSLGYRDLLAITGLWMASWIIAGLGFAMLVRALVPGSLSVAVIIICSGVYAIGWDIGFLSFITPSGLGFREAALAGLLVAAGLAPVWAVALAIAIVARLLVTAAELVCVAGVHLVRGGSVSTGAGSRTAR
jgi:hypothetical protein